MFRPNGCAKPSSRLTLERKEHSPRSGRLTPAQIVRFVTSQRSCDEPLAGNLSHFGPLIYEQVGVVNATGLTNR